MLTFFGTCYIIRSNLGKVCLNMYNKDSRQFRLGDVYLMEFTGEGNAQNGLRPGIVLQNNIGNIYSPNVIALPLTTRIKRVDLPSHVLLEADTTGLLKDSMVLCENPQTMSKDKIGKYITTLSYEQIVCICKAFLMATGVAAFVSPDEFVSVHTKTISLNVVA